MSSNWTILLDLYGMATFDVPRYFEADIRIREELTEIAGGQLSYRENFIDTLIEYIERTNRLILTLLVLQVPIYIFLAFYIYIISRQVLRLEQNDISILKSRGISRWQIVFVYFMQSALVSILSIALGIPLGVLVCQLLGASSGFLELTARAAIETPISRYVFLYSGMGAIASMIMMLLPVIGFSKISIIEHKRSRSRWQKQPFWQRYFLDILFLGISVYGYFNFISRREIMALAIIDIQAIDPLLFISSTLFIIGLGLLALRIYPYLVRVIFFIGKKVWSPSSYASLLKVIRFSSGEQYIMIFLVFTLSLGIFSATTARTLNTNNEHMIQHEVGADLIFAERFRDNIPPPDSGLPMPDRIVYTAPDFQRFTELPQVNALTRVMLADVDIRRRGNVFGDVTMMAIETDTFGETIWYRDDLLPVHINFFLNTLANYDIGMLMSKNFKTRYGFELEDRVMFTDDYGNDMTGVVVGFVEYWPGFTDRVKVEDSGGIYVFQDEFLIITNLGHIHLNWGVYPYQVWMNTNEPTNSFFHDLTGELNLSLIYFEDAKAAVIEGRTDPILQGTNGVLTAGFIFTFLACFVGYLIYWILSIKSRVLQFGVFRAMGMTKSELIRLLFYEQVLISFSAVAIGLVVGHIAAQLFVPLIQMAYSPSLQTIPLMIVIENRDYVNIFSIIGFMFILCLVILGVLVSKVKIVGALKLGED
jgi:putative ABC transport system permease protein